MVKEINRAAEKNLGGAIFVRRKLAADTAARFFCGNRARFYFIRSHFVFIILILFLSRYRDGYIFGKVR